MIDYIVYKEDYRIGGVTKKLGVFKKLPLAREYIWRIKDNYFNEPICLYIKCLGNILAFIDCLDGEISGKCMKEFFDNVT